MFNLIELKIILLNSRKSKIRCAQSINFILKLPRKSLITIEKSVQNSWAKG